MFRKNPEKSAFTENDNYKAMKFSAILIMNTTLLFFTRPGKSMLIIQGQADDYRGKTKQYKALLE